MLIGLMTLTGLGNPEARLEKHHAKRRELTTTTVPELPATPPREAGSYQVLPSAKRYTGVFTSFIWPKHPGFSGGEIRDFHLLRKLLESCSLQFIAVANTKEDSRADPLKHYLASLYDPKSITKGTPEMVAWHALRLPPKTRLLAWLRERKMPVWGPAFHADISTFSPRIDAYVIPTLEEILATEHCDFLFVSPQLNPVALQLRAIPPSTRLIMASYDVESVRIQRMAEAHSGFKALALQLEAQRAEVFERQNLALYDGVIAVSDLDKQTFMQRFGFEEDRVLVVENGVDTDYFSFRPRTETGVPHIIFIASLAYWPNHQAAERLLRKIMPLVRQRVPEARAWIVGWKPSRELRALADGHMDIVTGKVEDVRPFLDFATVACVPLQSGSLALERLDVRPGEHVTVAETDQEIADAIVRVIQQPDGRSHGISEARRMVEANYSWDRNLDKLDGWLRLIATLPKRGPAGAS